MFQVVLRIVKKVDVTVNVKTFKFKKLKTYVTNENVVVDQTKT